MNPAAPTERTAPAAPKSLQHARQLSLGLFPGAPGGQRGLLVVGGSTQGRPRPAELAGDAQKRLPIKG